MDDKAFRKHVKDLVHGHHHPDEHDWQAPDGEPRATGEGRGAGAATQRGPQAKRKPPKRECTSRVKRKGASG